MTDSLKEWYYNALAVRAGGDRKKIRKEFGRWRDAFGQFGNDNMAEMIPKTTSDAAVEWEKLLRADVRLTLADRTNFPLLLREIPDAPLGIYSRGDLMAASMDTLAIVGTRRATPEGKSIARYFARELARAGFTIVSGLAFGIDAAVHEGVLDARGRTVAVLAGGLHDIYPRENTQLAERLLAAGGALISEYPLGSPPYPERFVERNRLVSGLACGVIVVEAPLGSGSLTTARFAAEQGRDVYVVPGPIMRENYEGSHALIRQGAELVTRPEEVLASYGVGAQEKIARAAAALPYEERQVLKALAAAGAGADVDKISSLAKLEPRIVNRALALLVAKDIVRESGGGYTI